MRNKSVFLLLLWCFLTMLSLYACGSPDEKWPEYSGSMENYEFFYTDDRNRMWEEDILFVAEQFLNGHPRLADDDFFIRTSELPLGETEYSYSRQFFNDTIRNEFISEINNLIINIPKYNDAQIQYEVKKLVTILNDSVTRIDVKVSALIPFCFEPIGNEADMQFCLTFAAEGYESLLGKKLKSINNTPIEEIVAKMSSFFPKENDFWFIHQMVYRYDFLLLMQKNALCAVGVVDANDEQVLLTFETEDGNVSEIVRFISLDDYARTSMCYHEMLYSELTHLTKQENYWVDVVSRGDRSYIYVRIYSLLQGEYDINRFLIDVSNTIRANEGKAKLIIDLRDNRGGDRFDDAFSSFARTINRYEPSGTFILVNGATFATAVDTAYLLRNTIENAILVGSPTGQYINRFSRTLTTHTPNHGLGCVIPSMYMYGDPDSQEVTLSPDVIKYQTWSDYQESRDTVLEYVIALE